MATIKNEFKANDVNIYKEHRQPCTLHPGDSLPDIEPPFYLYVEPGGGDRLPDCWFKLHNLSGTFNPASNECINFYAHHDETIINIPHSHPGWKLHVEKPGSKEPHDSEDIIVTDHKP